MPETLSASTPSLARRDWLRTCSRLFWGAFTLLLFPLFVFYSWVSVLGPLAFEVAAAASAEGEETVRVMVLGIGIVWLCFWVVLRSVRYSSSAPAMPLGVARAAWGPGATREASRLERTARHEAAHAVVATAVGARVLVVDVIEHGVTGGQTIVEHADEQTLAGRAWEIMVLAIAGNVDDLKSGHFDFGASSDFQTIMNAAAALISTGQRPTGYDGDLVLDDLLVAAREQARGLLQRHAGVVDAIARRLVDQAPRPLEGEQLAELLAPVAASHAEVAGA